MDEPQIFPLSPKIALLVKLGSLIVHYQELNSQGGDPEFDYPSIHALETDPEVVAWLAEMTRMGFLPVVRNNPQPVPYRGKLKRGIKSK